MSYTPRRIATLAFALFLPLATASAQSAPSLASAQWLVGCWTRPEARGGQTVERWMAPEANGMFGSSRMIRGDTVRSYELLYLTAAKGKLSYVAHLANQLPTAFHATIANDTLLVFEDPEHDFPKEVRYRKVNADSIVATIAGPRNGQRVEIPTAFKRTACPSWK
jgi:hypothetical protein